MLLSRMDAGDEAYPTSIYRIHADGSGYIRLTDGPRDLWTSWSPDGARIAYASSKEDNTDIYLMNPDGSRPLRLTTDPAEDTHPDWSPDGTRIAFISKRDGTAQLYVMEADGTGQTQLSNGPGEKWNPRWSPDGRKIVFYGASQPGKDSVYVMNADGSERGTLGPGVWPSWSPDGSRILFEEGEQIYEMSPDGTNKTKRIEDAYFARWSPDGTRIAFLRTTWRAPEGWPSASDLFVARADGSAITRLTDNPED